MKWRRSDVCVTYTDVLWVCHMDILIAPEMHVEMLTRSQSHFQSVSCIKGDHAVLLLFVQHTHAFGGRSVSLHILCPFGWHGSFTWHVETPEVLLIDANYRQTKHSIFALFLSLHRFHTHHNTVRRQTRPVSVWHLFLYASADMMIKHRWGKSDTDTSFIYKTEGKANYVSRPVLTCVPLSFFFTRTPNEDI